MLCKAAKSAYSTQILPGNMKYYYKYLVFKAWKLNIINFSKVLFGFNIHNMCLEFRIMP